jgi:hypothetical protein
VGKPKEGKSFKTRLRLAGLGGLAGGEDGLAHGLAHGLSGLGEEKGGFGKRERGRERGK